ncbi:LysR family transcriptional regulator [Ralstonia mannitolilytica]|jgi:DNA-binding transcriptional LysR family regulator|uniref:HTH-type transcriptional regulator DmlR n=1 Tax=Ralstonia mannitolilytica TaxID=105219 RepID=A0AAD2EJ20_9RALS|nr:LysR family transcriptional regulator [Ralstonia mannitolilytica]ATG18552.1 LysR family transcriptional regulator [Ralstonia pickettii]ANA33377.1 LysR family transcriptional regulator [Ralstonia mannitolilytica]MBY4718222.1 LysR family transcriptional regulator [Ralstonia mannitolilytica]CAJ0681638.1 HTH-type transcriptional regulator DmlR [Ralstonia mannitolilytica]CAJ0682590.1 HTH-type transcriptional regulator DmlR [Ralstonia mannitolilytica]
MDKLKQIEAFIAVVEHGSMAAAALTQDVTPVMIGRRINALEARLGVKLLHRSTRRIAVTEQGAVFMEQCKKALGELDRAELLVAEGRHKATGHLIVSAPAAFGRKHVAPHAPDFLRANPDVRISFNLTDRVVDLVREGYDLGIRIGGAIDPNFVAIRLASNKRVVCGTPAYFAKHGVPRTLDDLAKHNCLAFNLQGGQQRGWYFQQNGKAVTVKVSGNLDCNDGELLHRWMGEGLGLGWRSTWEIQPELESGALMTVLDDYALPDYDILAVYPQQRPVPAKIRFFIEHLKTVFAQPGYWSRAG